MSNMTATDAKNRFGQLLEMARSGPVHIQKNGRDVGVMVSPQEYERLQGNGARPAVNPLVMRLLHDSMRRYRSVYEALAK